MYGEKLKPHFTKTITYLSLLTIISLFVLFSITLYSSSNNKENFSEYTGLFIRTDQACFFVADGDAVMFSKAEVVKIVPSNDTNLFNDFKSGDRIAIGILTVGDLNPRVTDVYQLRLLEKGDQSDLSESVVNHLESLGYKIE